jgi:ribosomal protein S18 acetylase RimI-like enzyme
MEHKIRPATLNDVSVLVELMTEFYLESGYALHEARSRDAFQYLLEDASLGQIWLLQQNEEIAGYIVLTLGFSMEFGGRDAFVDDLYLRPSFRGKGLGRAALDVLFAECRRRQVKAVHLEVDDQNVVAKSLYAHFGFRDTHRRLWSCSLSEPLHET